MFGCYRPREFTVPALLTIEDLLIIAAQGKSKAKRLMSAFRTDHRGKPTSVRVSMAIVDTNERRPEVFSKHRDVPKSSHEMSKSLAHKALSASHDYKASSTRSSGFTAGGVPLYKTIDGKTTLVGALGVSGDHPDQNEAVALAASSGFEAPEEIRESNYQNDEPVNEMLDVTIGGLPRIGDEELIAISQADLVGLEEFPEITPSASLLMEEAVEVSSGEPVLPLSPSTLPASPGTISTEPKISELPSFLPSIPKAPLEDPLLSQTPEPVISTDPSLIPTPSPGQPQSALEALQSFSSKLPPSPKVSS